MKQYHQSLSNPKLNDFSLTPFESVTHLGIDISKTLPRFMNLIKVTRNKLWISFKTITVCRTQLHFPMIYQFLTPSLQYWL